ncbi:MAG TPA: response regulator, partial [Anaeromyxobacteraceae bacterium]|nr:response regulator [Anaeromyxobacteraceae bacterium]
DARLREVAALVTDVSMPEMDGIALAVALRKRRPALPVLLVSGYAPGLEEPTLPGGLSARRLTKPFEPDQLAAEVRELIDQANAA